MVSPMKNEPDDDFLQRLRAEPSRKFLSTLKANLDRQTISQAKARRTLFRTAILAALIGGSTVAVAFVVLRGSPAARTFVRMGDIGPAQSAASKIAAGGSGIGGVRRGRGAAGRCRGTIPRRLCGRGPDRDHSLCPRKRAALAAAGVEESAGIQLDLERRSTGDALPCTSGHGRRGGLCRHRGCEPPHPSVGTRDVQVKRRYPCGRTANRLRDRGTGAQPPAWGAEG